MIDLNNIPLLTKEDILSPEMIDILFDLDEAGRNAKAGEVRKQAKALRCLTDFNKQYDERQKQQDKLEADRKKQMLETLNNNEFEFATAADTFKFSTGKWFVDQDGVRQFDEKGNEIRKASRYPIVITQRLVDVETNNGKIELSWEKEDEITSISVDRAIIANKSKIVELSNSELPVDSETARNLVTYLADFEKLNGDKIRRKQSISKYGWYRKQFVPYTPEPVLALPPRDKLLGAIEKTGHGNFQKWLDLALKIRASGRQEPLLYMAAALGSVLVPIRKISPFIVNLYSTTGRGKTINMKLAASIWGNPEKLIKEATSTINALEAILGTLNNVPLMIDDFSKIQDDGDSRKVTDIIYRLTAGSGKERIQPGKADYKTVEDTSTWSNIIITNMERPMETSTMKGGALNRVLDFEAQDGDIFEDFNEVINTVTENYGFAARVFILGVIREYDSIKAIINDFERKIKETAEKKGQRKEGKQIIPLAVLLAADRLAEKILFNDGIHLDLDYCIEHLKDVDSISEMKRAMQALEDEVITNRICYVPDGNDGNYRGRIYGKLSENEIFITQSRFKELAKENNFSSKQFIDWTYKEEILLHDAGKKTKRITLQNRAQIYCYAFRHDNPDLDQDGFMKVEDSETLPPF